MLEEIGGYEKNMDDDYCYECQGYGDDYYVNDEGELICRCDECSFNESNWEDGYWQDDI